MQLAVNRISCHVNVAVAASVALQLLPVWLLQLLPALLLQLLLACCGSCCQRCDCDGWRPCCCSGRQQYCCSCCSCCKQGDRVAASTVAAALPACTCSCCQQCVAVAVSVAAAVVASTAVAVAASLVAAVAASSRMLAVAVGPVWINRVMAQATPVMGSAVTAGMTNGPCHGVGTLRRRRFRTLCMTCSQIELGG